MQNINGNYEIWWNNERKFVDDMREKYATGLWMYWPSEKESMWIRFRRVLNESFDKVVIRRIMHAHSPKLKLVDTQIGPSSKWNGQVLNGGGFNRHNIVPIKNKNVQHLSVRFASVRVLIGIYAI